MDHMNTVCISKEEYLELIRKAERIEIAKRFYASNKYVSTGDILILMGIDPKEEDK